MQSLNEPYRLTRHTPRSSLTAGSLYTCARPGRSLGSKLARISDEVVAAWIAGIPTSNEKAIIVSLLGRKPTGLSEFSYYSFRGGFDRPADRPGCPTWQEWLNERYSSRYRVCEFPTEDTKQIPDDANRLVVNTLLEFMQSGNAVVLVDSGGVGRTGKVVSKIIELG
jgi:hypothetical protein